MASVMTSVHTSVRSVVMAALGCAFWVHRHLVRMGELGLCAVSPCNGFGCPVVIVVINVCPLVLALCVFFIQATSHVNTVFFELFVCKLFGLRCYCSVSVLVLSRKCMRNAAETVDVRRFLFQTAFASGAPGLLPLTAKRGSESLLPLPALATRRGREADSADGPGGGVFEPPMGRSVTFEGMPELFALAARKVLLTETALKVAGFLAAEPVRLWLWFPSLARDASVSDPPLTLTSVECSCSSTLVMRLLAMSSTW